MGSRMWFQVFLRLQRTSPMTGMMLFTGTASCSAYSHSATRSPRIWDNKATEINQLHLLYETSEASWVFQKESEEHIIFSHNIQCGHLWNCVFSLALLAISFQACSSIVTLVPPSSCRLGSQLTLSHIPPSLNMQYVFLTFHWVCHSNTREADYINTPRKCEGTWWTVNLFH